MKNLNPKIVGAGSVLAVLGLKIGVPSSDGSRQLGIGHPLDALAYAALCVMLRLHLG